MDAGVWEILGTNYYTHGFGLLFVAPFAFLFFISLIRMLVRASERKKFSLYGPFFSLICLVVVLVVVFWDVYQIGQQATKLCNEKAGLHVYRTAEAEGFIGDTSIEYWSEYGFDYVEYEYTSGRLKSKKFRYSMEGNKPSDLLVGKFKSPYELIITRKQLTPEIVIHQYEIIEVETSEVFGVAAKLGIDAGWADMFFYGITGFTYSPWICAEKVDGHVLNPGDIVEATLKPVYK